MRQPVRTLLPRLLVVALAITAISARETCQVRFKAYVLEGVDEGILVVGSHIAPPW